MGESMIARRSLLAGLGATGLSACAATPAPSPVIAAATPSFASRRIAPILMRPDRIIRITVCTRPFRASGPRLDVERIGETMVVHNYGHGGSGWSLCWGSSEIAAAKAMALAGDGAPVAVIGCGALGLTSALTLQRMGARVVIYARERPAQTRSMRATGTWSPDSRIADSARVGSEFADQWERMTRASFAAHQTYLGVEGDPVLFRDRYILSDGPGGAPRPAAPPPSHKPIAFATYGARVRDLTPRSFALPPGSTPFPVAGVRLGSEMQFNVTELARRLEAEFLAHGGRMVTRGFDTPADIAALPERVVINCTGYGAKALFGDAELTPVRGQIAWLSPQPEVDYGLHYRGVTVISRDDGIVVQATRNDMVGVGLDDETPDRAEAVAAIEALAPLFPDLSA